MHNFRISFLLFIPLFLKFYVMPCTLFINIKIASFFKLIIWTLITYTLHKIFNFNPTAIVSFLTCFYCAMRTIVSTHSFSPSPHIRPAVRTIFKPMPIPVFYGKPTSIAFHSRRAVIYPLSIPFRLCGRHVFKLFFICFE